MQKIEPTKKGWSKMKLFRLQKIEKGHNNNLHIHKRLPQKESPQVSVSTVGRGGSNGLKLHYRPALKLGQPKPLGNNTCIEPHGMDTNS